MKITNLSRPILLFIFSLVVTSCATTSTVDFDKQTVPPKPDYTQEASWVVLPNKYPTAFRKYAASDIEALPVDVFYVYPTLNTDTKDKRWNVPVNDKIQIDKVQNKAVLMQASAFAHVGKVYVPLYRQAHLRSYSRLNAGGKQALDLAYQDVRQAFETYLKFYNKGRPIVLVGHSQGTTHSLRLLEDFFDGQALQKKLVAAYIPGIRVTSDRFKTIAPMSSPAATGGFVSWNTFKKGKYPKKDKAWYKGSVTTNPISWDLSKVTTLDQHKGFLYTNGKLYSKALTIEITDGLVWSSNPKFPLRFFMSFIHNYHAGDINLFWQDIRENVSLRVATFLKKL